MASASSVQTLSMRAPTTDPMMYTSHVRCPGCQQENTAIESENALKQAVDTAARTLLHAELQLRGLVHLRRARHRLAVVAEQWIEMIADDGARGFVLAPFT